MQHRRAHIALHPLPAAGWAFFAFVLFQVPAFMAQTKLTREGYNLLSPLQIAAANLATTYPPSAPVMTNLLVPGTWTRDALSPYIRCAFKPRDRTPCTLERERLTSWAYVVQRTHLASLQEFIASDDMRGQVCVS